MPVNTTPEIFSAASMPDLLINQPEFQELYKQYVGNIARQIEDLTHRSASLAPDSAEAQSIARRIWCLNRYQGVSGTGASCVMGHNSYRSKYHYFNTLTGRHIPDDSTSRFAHWGTIMEAPVAEEYKRRSGNNIIQVDTAISPLFPFMTASVDRIIVDEDMNAVGILEVKTAAFATPAWGPGNKYIEVMNKDGSIGRQLVEKDGTVPQAYRDQVMHYMIAYGIYSATLVALIGGNDYREYTIDFDPEYAEQLIRAEDEFFCMNVLKDIAPAMSAADTDEIEPVQGSEVEATSEIIDKLNEYVDLQDRIKELTDQSNLLKDAIKEFAGTNEGITIGGKVAAKYSFIRRKGTLDTKSLELDMPDLVERYRKPATSYRTLTVKL